MGATINPRHWDSGLEHTGETSLSCWGCRYLQDHQLDHLAKEASAGFPQDGVPICSLQASPLMQPIWEGGGVRSSLELGACCEEFSPLRSVLQQQCSGVPRSTGLRPRQPVRPARMKDEPGHCDKDLVSPRVGHRGHPPSGPRKEVSNGWSQGIGVEGN